MEFLHKTQKTERVSFACTKKPSRDFGADINSPCRRGAGWGGCGGGVGRGQVATRIFGFQVLDSKNLNIEKPRQVSIQEYSFE